MARVVLIWNEHPTEVVAGFHARKVAEILRKKYGHEVIVEKVPMRETNYGILTSTAPERAARLLRKIPHSGLVAERYTKMHNAYAFNFHSSLAADMGHATVRPPEDFRVVQAAPSTELPAEIVLSRGRLKSAFIVETPGVMLQLPKKLSQRRRSKIRRTRRHTYLFDLDEYEKTSHELRSAYHTKAMQLAHPSQQKYLHPAISEKIAAAIHERIKRVDRIS